MYPLLHPDNTITSIKQPLSFGVKMDQSHQYMVDENRPEPLVNGR